MKPSLRVIFEIVRKEFHQVRQDRRMMAVSIMAPILQVVLLGYAATTDVREIQLVVCDGDRSSESRALVRRFTNSSYFLHKFSVDAVNEVDRHLDDGTAMLALVIPRGFGSALLAGETAPLQAIIDGTDANTATIILGYASQITAAHSQSLMMERSSRVAGSRMGMVIPEPRIWFNPELKSSHFMVPGVIALVLMIITMTLTSLGIVREKEVGTLEQLMVTPISPVQLILGKLVPFVIIGFLDVLFVLAIARFWFGVPLLGSLALLFALSGLFILTTLGLGLFISTIARSQQQAMLIAQFFFFMPFMFLSGFAFPISNMPEIIQYVTYAIPLRYFLEIVRGIFLKGATLSELWPQALALLGFGILILTLSTLRFQKKLE